MPIDVVTGSDGMNNLDKEYEEAGNGASGIEAGSQDRVLNAGRFDAVPVAAYDSVYPRKVLFVQMAQETGLDQLQHVDVPNLGHGALLGQDKGHLLVGQGNVHGGHFARPLWRLANWSGIEHGYAA